MKKTIIVILAMATIALAQTNVVENPSGPTSPAGQAFQPILELLGGKAGNIMTTLIAWIVAISIALAPFSGMISRRLRDMLNEAAESSKLDDDDYLRRLFSRGWYQTAAFLLRFINVDLPTTAELDRAIALQKEAIAEASSTKP